MARSAKGLPVKQGKQVLRIIGGEWRGRKLRFEAVKDCRPTPDRVRETLFNWLMHKTRGAKCLDLFSGSGALGLEALSRGAEHVVFVDIDARAAKLGIDWSQVNFDSIQLPPGEDFGIER